MGLVPLVFAATRELMVRDRDRFLAANGLTPGRYERLAARPRRPTRPFGASMSPARFSCPEPLIGSQ